MSMTPDPYRSAYEKALADLSFIAERHEWLNTRKRHVENLISALQPVSRTIQPGFDDLNGNSCLIVQEEIERGSRRAYFRGHGKLLISRCSRSAARV